MKDFSNYKYRASQCHKLLTGTIGISETQEQRIKELENERDTGINVNGNKCKFTPNKKEELADLIAKKKDNSLPKTMQSELRKIYRAEKFNRNFEFSTKFTTKGIVQEEESITTYQIYRNAKGVRTFFTKNTKRLYNDFFQGEPDLNPMEIEVDGVKKMIGFDVKSAWDLSTFPFPEDNLIDAYETQNQVYMNLTGADMWITATILVNCTEQLLHNEKMKKFYELAAPNEDHKNYEVYIKKCKEFEKQLIFDYDRFVDVFPYHDLQYTREEWMKENNNIPLKDRVLEKVSYRDENKINALKQRAKIGREYMMKLQKEDEEKILLI